MSDELKIKRGHKKAAFTKSIYKLRRAVGLKDDSTVPELLIIIEREFDAFQLAHQEYHETLTEENAIEESEHYFELLDESNVVALQEVGSLKEASTHPIDKMSMHFSSWKKLQRSVAWLMLLQHRYRARTNVVSMDSEMMSHAELVIIRHVQMKHYGDEIEEIQKTGHVKYSNKLSKLMPRLEDGLLTVGGRVTHGTFDERFKHPYIIPHDHLVATLIVRCEHDVAHLGQEWVLSILRRRYWITRARNLVSKVSRDCITCKKKFAKPMQQKMADLPAERLDWQHPPFYYVGVDCFGPFAVNYGRSSIKRYGCIFTCMSSRAVHLEKLNGLDTDSFMNCLRRFIARRGLPSKMFSDNGTNLVSGCKEARSFCDVRDAVDKKGIEWCFNPPSASHMGGVWERMIRT